MADSGQTLEGILTAAAVIICAKAFDTLKVRRQKRPRRPKITPAQEREELHREWAELRDDMRKQLADCRKENTYLRRRITALENWKQGLEAL